MVLRLIVLNYYMIIPFIALVVIIIGLVVFLTKAGKRKSEGKDLGENGMRKSGVHS